MIARPLASRDGRPAGIRIGGFNLLPYRQRVARGRRRRLLIEATVAALAGVLAALGWSVSDGMKQAGLSERRAALESTLAALAAPLAEHRELERIGALASERAELAAQLVRPRTRILDVADALGRVPLGGVTVHRLEMKDGAVEIGASVADSEASSAWINRLASVRGVRSAEITDWRLAAQGAPYATNVQARLQWEDPETGRASSGHSAVGRGRR
jgi:Tfp pilus assembly protein PilN